MNECSCLKSPEEGVGSPEAAVTGDCEPIYVDSWSQIQILCKGSMCS